MTAEPEPTNHTCTCGFTFIDVLTVELPRDHTIGEHRAYMSGFGRGRTSVLTAQTSGTTKRQKELLRSTLLGTLRVAMLNKDDVLVRELGELLELFQN